MSSSVCDTQNDFNVAFREAVKHDVRENEKKMKPMMYVSGVLMLIFLVWALLLAMQVPAGSVRILHLVFAIIFSPVYVIGYYLGMIGSKGAEMGMCGCSKN